MIESKKTKQFENFSVTGRSFFSYQTFCKYQKPSEKAINNKIEQ